MQHYEISNLSPTLLILFLTSPLLNIIAFKVGSYVDLMKEPFCALHQLVQVSWRTRVQVMLAARSSFIASKCDDKFLYHFSALVDYLKARSFGNVLRTVLFI
ncbi:hypothetical protein Gasu2_03880 [Galdieria sulphuraria]|nr:hypothetical protein Gasu2_03880 [Galdieria sulphuraria]